MNILTGRCDHVPLFGECPKCHGPLLSGHKCPSTEVIVERSEAESPPKLTQMIRLWLAANGVEQRELAEAWGTAPSVVSRFLNGQNVPDGRTTARIIAWLFDSAEGSQ